MITNTQIDPSAALLSAKNIAQRRTEDGERLARSLIKLISDPRKSLEFFAPETLKRANKISAWIDFVKRCIYTIIIILCAIRIIAVIPEDIIRENNRQKFFALQRQNDCYSEYLENSCNNSNIEAPALQEKCRELFICYSEAENGIRKSNLITLEWEIINCFFFFLSKKSAAFLGFLCGCFLYTNLLKSNPRD